MFFVVLSKNKINKTNTSNNNNNNVEKRKGNTLLLAQETNLALGNMDYRQMEPGIPKSLGRSGICGERDSVVVWCALCLLYE